MRIRLALEYKKNSAGIVSAGMLVDTIGL